MSLDISFWYKRELTKSDGLSLNIEEELYTDNITHNGYDKTNLENDSSSLFYQGGL
jgi:hypothetical protein